ncbi:MAG: diaminopimelate epimerase, partial [Alphaproteobacteria bacterium]|nr:diaminopimelate epimerase [Alphaproteobacteria bacterium]
MIPFTKMHGLGNDFVVIDRRTAPITLATDRIRAIADRRRGVGFDQLVLIDPPTNGRADVFLRFHNPDGGEAGACGNGTRCAAALIMGESGRPSLSVQTNAGLLAAEDAGNGLVAVDMGAARTDWHDIPLAREQDTLHVDLALGPLSDPVAVNMGNPHAVFFVADAEAIDLATLGPTLEHDPLFPERA